MKFLASQLSEYWLAMKNTYLTSIKEYVNALTIDEKAEVKKLLDLSEINVDENQLFLQCLKKLPVESQKYYLGIQHKFNDWTDQIPRYLNLVEKHGYQYVYQQYQENNRQVPNNQQYTIVNDENLTGSKIEEYFDRLYLNDFDSRILMYKMVYSMKIH